MVYVNILDFMEYDDYTFLEAYSIDYYVIEFNTVHCIQAFSGIYARDDYSEKSIYFLKHYLNAAVRRLLKGNRSQFRKIFKDSPTAMLLLEPELYAEFFINVKRDCSVSVEEFINDCFVNVNESEYLDYTNVNVAISAVEDVDVIIGHYSMILGELCNDTWNDVMLTEFKFLNMFIESIFTYNLEDLVDWNRIWHINFELMSGWDHVAKYMESLTGRHPKYFMKNGVLTTICGLYICI